MFKPKHANKMWFAVLIIAVLLTVSIILQGLILTKLEDFQTFILKSTYVMDTNPLPPRDYVMDTNPLPPRTIRIF